MILASSEEEWGYFDNMGRCIHNFYNSGIDTLWPFKEGLAKFYQNKKYGFIDKQGKIAIPPTYNQARQFSEGLAAVKINKLWGFINRTGHIDINPRCTLSVKIGTSKTIIVLDV